MHASRYYYQAQIAGWALYILISTVLFINDGRELTMDAIGGIYLVFALGVLVTHFYRAAIIRLGWLDKDFFRLAPRVIVACISLAIAFHSVYILIGNAIFGWQKRFEWNDGNLFTWAMLFFMWNLLYFSYIFFQRFRNVEIKNLRLEAARNEYELRRLRDQMNPHFIFNAMNTIRALIDEDPVKAKNAVTQLSNVLRSSLQTGQEDLIPLAKELEIVRDFLEIEQARYEERLRVEYDLDPAALQMQLPPLMLQTIVENSIKHGIATKPSGGTISIRTYIDDPFGVIEVSNPGLFAPARAADAQSDVEGTGSLGLENTRNRLALSYGDDATFEIKNVGHDTVQTTITIPLKKQL